MAGVGSGESVAARRTTPRAKASRRTDHPAAHSQNQADTVGAEAYREARAELETLARTAA